MLFQNISPSQCYTDAIPYKLHAVECTVIKQLEVPHICRVSLQLVDEVGESMTPLQHTRVTVFVQVRITQKQFLRQNVVGQH